MSPIKNRTCIICGNKGTRGFFTFPANNPFLRREWLNQCGRTVVKDHDKICSKHFKPDDFYPRRSQNQCLLLRKNVVPSLNLPQVRNFKFYPFVGSPGFKFYYIQVNLHQTWTKLGRNLDQTWTKLGPNLDQTWTRLVCSNLQKIG